MFLEHFKDRQPNAILEPGEVLFHQGQRADSAYIIHSGSLELFLGENQIAVIGPDELIGEMALFEDEKRVATAVGGPEGARLFRLDKADFERVMSHSPQFAIGVMRKSMGRLRGMNSEVLKYKYTVDSMSDGVVTMDSGGAVVAVNDAALVMLGLGLGAVSVGARFDQAFAAGEGPGALAAIVDATLKSGAPIRNRIITVTAGDYARRLAVTTSFYTDIDADGVSRNGVIASLRDVTELEKLREAEAALTRELSQRHQDLQRAYMEIETNNSELASNLKKVQSLRVMATTFVVLVIVMVALFSINLGATEKTTAVTVSAEAEKARLLTMPVAFRPVSTLGPLPGFMAPAALTSVPSPLDASIERVNAVTGQFVDAGYALLKLDTSDLRDRIEKANQDYVTRADELAAAKSAGDAEAVQKTQANFEAAAESIHNLENKLKQATVTAPRKGTIVKSPDAPPLAPGGAVKEGAPLVTLADLDNVIFIATVDHLAALYVREGQRVRVVAKAFEGASLDGTVMSVEPLPEPSSALQVVVGSAGLSPEQRASYNPKGSLDATVEIYDRPDAMTAPISAVSVRGGQATVKVWDQSLGRARLTPIQTGVTTLDTVEILAGLAPGDELVIE